MIFKYFFLAITSSTIFALLEIQIEGKHGWAKNLPTWKIYKPWFKKIPGANKPITGYHIFVWLSVSFLPHTPLIFIPWSIWLELILISFILFVLRLEDFLWFVFNPHYGIKKFKPEYIPWHQHWHGKVPSQYWLSFIIWAALFYLGLKNLDISSFQL